MIDISLSRESWTVHCLLFTAGLCLKSFRVPSPYACTRSFVSISFLIAFFTALSQTQSLLHAALITSLHAGMRANLRVPGWLHDVEGGPICY